MTIDPWIDGFGFCRNSHMLNQLKIMFCEIPTDLDDFILASQIVQAEAMKTFAELFRSQKFTKKNGLIWLRSRLWIVRVERFCLKIPFSPCERGS